ncbi:hypothetical protein Clacol_007596 [Clathrus columnatus]|uniref:F-box domain-containing protein n=1 Tax=Clathrus columnatus TaxID=1419009 RepID=A0AAV5AKW6_9AGAM|nr:hypothetical protein Clacol_007596 [Clathrus columnatus]
MTSGDAAHIDPYVQIMDKLPSELIVTIFEKLYYNINGAVDYHSLRWCCSVCRSWKIHAQELLFRAPSLLSREHASSFLHAILKIDLAGHVRVLNISVDAIGDTQRFAHVVISCRRLYHLRMGAASLLSFDRPTMAILSKIPPIKALSVLAMGVQSTFLYQLLRLLPGLAHLCMAPEWHATPPVDPPGFQLYELILRRALHPVVLLWLLSASPSLRIFEMWDMCDPATMHCVMEHHGSSIRSFRFACSNLEELVIWNTPTFIPLDNLPTSIQHLSFRNPPHSRSNTLSIIIDAIQILPKLELVTCDKATSTEVSDFERLVRTCETLNVTLLTTNSSYPIAEDPVPWKKFPRRNSVSNYRYMNV